MTEEQIKIVSDEIKIQRFKNKIKQEDIAEVLKISRETYRKLENNPDKISVKQALAISSTLNWNLLDFITSCSLQNAK